MSTHSTEAHSSTQLQSWSSLSRVSVSVRQRCGKSSEAHVRFIWSRGLCDSRTALTLNWCGCVAVCLWPGTRVKVTASANNFQQIIHFADQLTDRPTNEPTDPSSLPTSLGHLSPVVVVVGVKAQELMTLDSFNSFYIDNNVIDKYLKSPNGSGRQGFINKYHLFE